MIAAAEASGFDGAFHPLLDFVSSARVELCCLVSFGVFWFICRVFDLRFDGLKPRTATSSKKPKPAWAARQGGQHHGAHDASRPEAAPSRRRPIPGRSAGGQLGSGEPTLDVRSPTREQLCDGAWVTAAVQQLCKAQVQRALDLYREALRAGLDVGQLSSADGAQLFMALVTAAIRLSQPQEALRVLRDCRQKGPGVSCTLLASATKLCTSKQLFKDCLEIYDFVAQDEKLVVDDRSIWSCLIFCVVETRAYNRCNFFFGRLKTFGTPSHKDYGNMIRYASTQGDWQLSLSLIAEMREARVEIDNVVYNTALATCVAASQTDKARFLLEEMERGEGIADVITYNTLAKGYAKAGLIDKCFELYEHMRSKGIVPSQVTYGILLDSCINEKLMDKALEVFNSMTEQGCTMNTVLYTTLIKGFARAEQIDEATQVYERMRADKNHGVTPDLITFSILIKANCDAGRLDKALGLLEAMMELKLCPDEVIFNNLLGGCVREHQSSLAKRLYHNMVEGGIRPSNATFSIMIRMYSTCRMLDEAAEMLRTEPAARGVSPEPRLYVQLAQACLRDRQGRRAVEVYKLMLERTSPTASMNSSLLATCTKLNMLGTGAELLALAADNGVRVDLRDANELHETAVKKKKTNYAEEIAAVIARLPRGSTATPAMA